MPRGILNLVGYYLSQVFWIQFTLSVVSGSDSLIRFVVSASELLAGFSGRGRYANGHICDGSSHCV